MSASANLDTLAKNLRDHFHTTKHSTTFDDDMVHMAKSVMKHISRPLIHQMGISQDSNKPIILLDSACGSGVVTQEVQGVLEKGVLQASSFICSDFSEAMVDLVKRRIDNEKWVNVEARVLDATNTGLPDNSFSHVALALGLHIIPNPDVTVKECVRIIKPGGTFGASTFAKKNSQIFWVPDMRSAFKSLPFDAPFPDEVPMQVHDSGHWDDEEWVLDHLAELGLKDVAVNLSHGSYRVEDAAEFVAMFGMIVSWVMSSVWTAEMRREHSVDEVKVLIRKYLEEKHEGNGWSIEWEAIIMTGTVSK